MPDSPSLIEGNPASPVRVVIYEDLECGDCAWMRRKLDQHLLPRYGETVGFEHRDFPLPKHDWARQAAIAGRHFQSIGHGTAIAFRRDILADMASISAESLPDWIRTFAENYVSDPDAAVAALDDPALAALVDADVQAGKAANVEKTPTVFAGDRVFIEWVPMDELVPTLDAALRAAGKES